jgi:hypothetical protein
VVASGRGELEVLVRLIRLGLGGEQVANLGLTDKFGHWRVWGVVSSKKMRETRREKRTGL